MEHAVPVDASPRAGCRRAGLAASRTMSAVADVSGVTACAATRASTASGATSSHDGDLIAGSRPTHGVGPRGRARGSGLPARPRRPDPGGPTPRLVSRDGAHVVARVAIDQLVVGIDSGPGGLARHGDVNGELTGSHVMFLKVQDCRRCTSSGIPEHAHVDPVIDRHFDLTPAPVGFELSSLESNASRRSARRVAEWTRRPRR